MKIKAKLDYPKIPENQPFTVRLMVTMVPLPGRKQEKKRVPLNLGVVLDHSGSMSRQKLEYVKEATKILMRQLGREDVFSLTLFETGVTPLIRPVKMGAGNGHLEMIVDRIHAAQTTNLSGGYFQGRNFVREYMNKKSVNRIILLTDGLANVGITDPERLCLLAAKNREEGISTTTIGVGEDYDEVLLGKMAESGGGATYYIENPDDAPGVFKEELGYLLDLAAQDVQLYFQPGTTQIQAEQLNAYPIMKDGAYYLGDLYSGQEKHIVFELSFPPLAAGYHDIGRICLSGRLLEDDDNIFNLESEPVRIRVVGSRAFRNVKADREVTLQSAFLLVARAKSGSMKLANSGDFDEAAHLLEDAAGMLEELHLNDKHLNQEIRGMRKRARNLRKYREQYYTARESKRIFYEDEMMSTDRLSSYVEMIKRRKD